MEQGLHRPLRHPHRPALDRHHGADSTDHEEASETVAALDLVERGRLRHVHHLAGLDPVGNPMVLLDQEHLERL